MKTLEIDNIKVLVANFYDEKHFEKFETENVDALFIRNPGIYVGKNVDAYKYEVINKIKENYAEDNIFFPFGLNGKPILICDSNTNVKKTLEFMKQAKVEYCLDIDKQILYFNGIIMDKRFVNTLRKKLNLEVLKFHEI